MGIVLASNFDVKTGLSLDSRYNADTISDRNSIPVGIRYDGMQCYVKEDESLYILSGNDLSDNNNWTKSPYAKDYMPISGGTFTGQVDWYFGGDDTLELSISKDNGIVSRNDYTSSAGSKLVIADGEITITDNYGDFKNCVAEAVIEHLKPLQALYFDLMKNQDYLCAVLEEGKRVAQERAFRMMSKVYKKIGMI